MSGAIIKLQEELVDTKCDLVASLRKAHLIASKLELKEFDKWILSELNGYQCSPKEVPDYRMVKGNLSFQHPFYGWRPVILQDNATEELLCYQKLMEPIGSVIDLGNNPTQKDIVIYLPAGASKILNKYTDAPFETMFVLFVSVHYLNEIANQVKNCLLEWTITLEKKGIIGDNMVFNNEESLAAKTVPQEINNYYGSVVNGNISNAQISTGDKNNLNQKIETLLDLPQKIRDSLNNENISQDDLATANELVDDLEEKINGGNKHIIKILLNGLKDFVLGIGASMTATVIAEALPKLI